MDEGGVRIAGRVEIQRRGVRLCGCGSPGGLEHGHGHGVDGLRREEVEVVGGPWGRRVRVKGVVFTVGGCGGGCGRGWCVGLWEPVRENVVWRGLIVSWHGHRAVA